MKASLSRPALAIDSSGSFCSVALWLSDTTVCHRESDGAGDHFERLSAIVSEVLSVAAIQATDLAEIRIGVGPGSFTGLRIGMSFAKGMASALSIPLIGVSSFAGIANIVARTDSSDKVWDVLVVADARREEVFFAHYGVSDGQVREVKAPCITPVAEVIEWLAKYPAGVVASPSADLPQVMETWVQSAAIRVEPRVAQGLLMVDVGAIEPFSVMRLAELEPNYLRAVAAKSIQERKGS